MAVYKSVCQERMPRTISDKVDMLLYLDVDPAECHRRVTSLRKNKAEDGIPLSYLEAVDTTYFHLLMDWLANRKGGFHDMNIGPAPPVAVFRWDKYGSMDEVLMALSSLRHGSRRSPVVTFVEDVVPSTLLGSELVLDTEQDVDSAYQLLVKSGNPSTMSAAYEEGAPRKVCVNWNLVHSNGFRRVLMYYLSECGHVVCYGDTHQSSTPSAEQ